MTDVVLSGAFAVKMKFSLKSNWAVVLMLTKSILHMLKINLSFHGKIAVSHRELGGYV